MCVVGYRLKIQKSSKFLKFVVQISKTFRNLNLLVRLDRGLRQRLDLAPVDEGLSAQVAREEVAEAGQLLAVQLL